MLQPPGVLPQAAWRLDPDRPGEPDEVLLEVERLNLDAASYRQLREETGGEAAAMRARVLAIVAERGKMHNPVTDSGGVLLGRVRWTGPASPLGLQVGQRVVSLVSLTLTPLRITDALEGWDGTTEQVPAAGTAVLFARSLAALLPTDLPERLALAVLDVCGAAALTARVVSPGARVCVLGGAGKSGSLALAAAGSAGAGSRVAVVHDAAEAAAVGSAGLAEQVCLADACDPVAVARALGRPADVTVVCVDVAGAEGAAVLATRPGGTVVFFSMATSFAAAALTAEGLAAEVTLLIGSGYLPGHADLALDLVRTHPGLRAHLQARIDR